MLKNGLLIVAFVSIFSLSIQSEGNVGNDSPEVIIDEENLFDHVENSYTVSLAVGLLLLITLTSYISKKYRFKILPDATLCLLYGLVVGLILRYVKTDTYSINTDLKLNSSVHKKAPIIAVITLENVSYAYRLSTVVSPDSNGLSEMNDKLLFNPEIFFYLILPPIMFVAGSRMDKKMFVKNLGTVMTIAIVGSTITSFMFAGQTYLYRFFDKSPQKNYSLDFSDSLLFGSIVAPTDPVSILTVFNDLKVDPTLEAIVFGECALNDVVSLVLFETVEHYILNKNKTDGFHGIKVLKSIGVFFGVSFGSLVVGVFTGICGAIVTKTLSLSEYPILETSFYILNSYSSYLLGELAKCTGVVSVLFCGMFNAHYTSRNLSYEARMATHHFFELIDFFATNFVFSYMGLSVFSFTHHAWDFSFISWTLISLFCARAFIVYFLCFILNFFRKEKITMNFQHILFFAGLKGAVSFALSMKNTVSLKRRMILTSTVVMVLFTVLLFGSLISKLMVYFKIPLNVTSNNENSTQTAIVSENNEKDIVGWWQKLDYNYLIPFFTKSGPPISVTLRACFKKILNFCCCCFFKKNNYIENEYTEPSNYGHTSSNHLFHENTEELIFANSERNLTGDDVFRYSMGFSNE